MENTKIKVKKISVYTDGSCSKKGQKSICGYGIVFPNKELNDISKPFTIEPLTNQRAELYAIYKAIKKVHQKCEFDELMIYSDSEYSIKSVTIWIKSWKKNGWKTANGKEVLNQDIIKKIDRYLEKYKGKIFFQHVKAHAGHEHNEKADQLAKKGAQK